ncbi:MAG: hypothetical protein H7645_00970 [Candidatus Heimdallarchaeota archaeon]|nr:hypothetical protein [Candidatus Heimdallarchaeota archaeon]MCK4768887.1 hypothetical protein [Candidatus Heimdallarchaeota archaeon]
MKFSVIDDIVFIVRMSYIERLDYFISMVLPEKDANAQILRNFTDFYNKPNQYFLTNLAHVIPNVLDQTECFGDAKTQIDTAEGINIVKRDYKINNMDIAYLVVLTTRGYRFRSVMNKIYLCEENAIYPDFERFPPIKPKLSDNFNTKTAILNGIVKGQEKTDDELIRELTQSLPEILERAYGVLYTGRFLSINEWMQIKEVDGDWISEEVFRFKSLKIEPWMIGNLLILQARGWYFQEIPEKFKTSDYVFMKKF